MTQQLFRLEETHPFDPAVFGFPRGALPACNRGGGGTSAPPPRAAHYARTQIVPVGNGLRYGDDPEREYLLDRRNEARGGIDLPSSLTLCAAVALWTTIIGVVFIMYWQFSSSLAAAQTAVQPYFGEAINHTMSILHHVDSATLGADAVMHGAHDLTATAVPAIQLALNQSTAIIRPMASTGRSSEAARNIAITGKPPGTVMVPMLSRIARPMPSTIWPMVKSMLPDCARNMTTIM